MSDLAILGGSPAFPDGLPFVRPPAPPLAGVVARLTPSYERGALTNGPLVRELETRVAERLGVRHVVATASCTSGLLLVLRALELRSAVVLPSFTFSASAHAVAWNGLEPRFADCRADTFQLDPDDASGRLAGAGAILATHVFGSPADVDRLAAIAHAAGVPLVYDAAHGFGATHGGRPLGSFGAAEVFSLSPTKPLIAGEGGLVATNDEVIARSVQIGRDYGNPGNYDTQFVGLNARMSELHAAVALESLDSLDDHLATRRTLAARYRSELAGVGGVALQAVASEDASTFKDLTIVVEPDVFGLERDDLAAALRAEGIDTRCYFSPPVHRQRAYADVRTDALPVTDRVAARVLSLPLYPAMSVGDVDRVASVIGSLHEHADAVRAAIAA
jgi:dTDP-4-amino-4,6-dideoxygalactose transaminase